MHYTYIACITIDLIMKIEKKVKKVHMSRFINH